MRGERRRTRIAPLSATRKKRISRRGEPLLADVQNGRLILIAKPARFAAHLAGLHREVWEGTTADEYLNQERGAWNNIAT